jgi:hypothetical protein
MLGDVVSEGGLGARRAREKDVVARNEHGARAVPPPYREGRGPFTRAGDREHQRAFAKPEATSVFDRAMVARVKARRLPDWRFSEPAATGTAIQ